MKTKAKKNKTHFDAVIVGGGLSGLTMSCLLGRAGLKVACIDQADPKTKPRDLRTTAISFGSRKTLEKAGIWDRIKQPCPIEDIQVLDGHSPVLLNFMSTEVGGKAFGWIVDNHDLKCAMMSEMKTHKNVKHIAPATVEGFEVNDESAAVFCADGKTYQADLLIGADGRQSGLRKWMEIHTDLYTRQWSYNQRAVICTAEHEHPHNNAAVEHFWPEGPFAILPMADDQKSQDHYIHRSSIVFTEHGPARKSFMRLSDEEFEMALAARFPDSYGAVKLSGRRAAYPLGLIHASRYTAPRMVLVADAAHGIHPIAGQGLNLGFRDIDCLSALLTNAYEKGEDIAAPAVLKSYERKRRPDNMAMVAVTDGLTRLFSNDLKSVRFLRRTGLRLVSRLKPAKRFFMKQAMGDR